MIRLLDRLRRLWKPSPPVLYEPEDPGPPLTSPPEVPSEDDDGYRDLTLYVAEWRSEPDGGLVVRGEGRHQSRPLALEVCLLPNWEASTPSGPIPLKVHWGQVEYRSLGPVSDDLLRVMAQAYEIGRPPDSMCTRRLFSAAVLQGDPAQPTASALRIKLFHEAEDENDYAEWFTNIDLASRRLEIREKDSAYREAIIRVLTAGDAPSQ